MVLGFRYFLLTSSSQISGYVLADTFTRCQSLVDVSGGTPEAIVLGYLLSPINSVYTGRSEKLLP